MRPIRKYESTGRKGDPVQFGRGIYKKKFAAFIDNFERARKFNKRKAMTTSQLLRIFETELKVKIGRKQAQKYLDEAVRLGLIHDSKAYYEVE